MIFSEKYEVLEKIGYGGQGVVYRVRRLDFDDMILALKVLPHNLSQEPDLVARFKQEAKVMFGLHHNNIVRVYDFAKDEETYYLTMEFLAGKNLREHLRGHLKATGAGLPLTDVLTIGAQIADALAYAHEQAEPVVHRDIKPSNIIICEGSQKAVVTDFGIAKVLVEQQSDISRFGFVGTPPYCPPEQLRHDKELDGRVDIYALGMVLFECYTGRRFIPTEWSDNEVIARIGYGSDENEIDLPDAPPLFVQVLGRAIARDRDERFPTARAFTAALRECLAVLGSPGTASEGLGDLTQTGSIEAQIRALERKRVHREAEKARETCRKARTDAEQAGAAIEAATEFGRAVERQQEAEERFEHKDNQPARALFREAAAAFESAAVRSQDRRAAQHVTEAHDAMLATQREAVEARAAELAADAWARAEGVAADAAEAASRGEHERAAARFGEASDAYRGAINEAVRAHEIAELRTSAVAIADVRGAAERAEAEALAPDEFAAAERDRARLEQALTAGEVTIARDMLGRAREGFEAAGRKAAGARLEAAAQSTRERIEDAATVAREAGADEFAAEELAGARRRAESAYAAMNASDWEALSGAAERAIEEFGRAGELARERREAGRARATLAEAHAAMDTAQRAAVEAGAPDEAATLVGRAAASAARGDAASTTDPAAAAREYHRAADEYAEATALAGQRLRRRGGEQTMQAVRDAHARARASGCESVASFAAAERSLDEAERALAADDVERSAVAATVALAAFAEAERELELSHRLDAADRALERLDALREQAHVACAEAPTLEPYESAERTYAEARERRRAGDADGVLPLVARAEKDYAASVTTALKRARSDCSAAKAASLKAGVTADAVAGANDAEGEAERQHRAGASAAAAVKFRAAAGGYAAAIGDVRTRASAARAGALEAQRIAEEHQAERLVADAFAAASKRLVAAESQFAGERFADAMRAFSECATAYGEIVPAAQRARARAAATAARTAAEEARNAAAAAGAGELTAPAFESASREIAVAEAAFGAEQFADAGRAFEGATRAFADARTSAEEVSRLRARASDLRVEAERAAAAASEPGAGELARAELEAAANILSDAERAYAGKDFAAAESAFARAAAAFSDAKVQGERRRTQRDAEASAVRVRAMRDAVRRLPKQGRAGGLRGRWRVGRADRSLARADGALASGDFSAARSRFEEAAGLLETVLPERWDDEAPLATVIGPPAAPPRHYGMLATVSTALVLAVATVIGVREMGRSTQLSTPTATTESERARPNAKPDDLASVSHPRAEPQRPVQNPVQPTVVPEPPRILSYDPPQPTVPLTKGATAKFAIQLADASDASYEWQIDGRKISDTGPIVRFSADGDAHTVSVIARTRGGDVSHAWDLAAVAPQPLAPQPPLVTRLLPADEIIEIPASNRRRFQVAAKSAGNARLAYAWSVDGTDVGTDAPSFDFTPREEDEGPHRVKVDVTDEAKQVASLSWKVTVPLAPVTIAAQQPQQDVRADVGAETELTTVAKVGDRREVPLAYRWSLDGKPVPSATGPRFTYRMGNNDAQVQVVVSAPGRKSGVAAWRLRPNVAVASIPRASPVVAQPPPRAKPDDAERELREWIEAYRSAYQNKNVDRLVALGVLPPNQRDHMERVFGDLEDLRVEVSDETIKVDPDGTATVAFTRKDSFKGGRSNAPVHITKSLRKRDGAWVSR